MRFHFSVLTALLGCVFAPSDGVIGAERRIQFNRDVQPILSNHCFRCHGPDEASREAGLRLDVREVATGRNDNGAIAIVPGKPAGSELLIRIESTDPDLVMPPPEALKPLSPKQKEILRRWVAEGADYAEHWAFVPPNRTTPPAVLQSTWPRNAVDNFILHRLEAEGLKPGVEADRGTWLRRVTLDLTGLPPAPAELKSFLSDRTPKAFEKVVDRLLTSSAHAERMAMHWLDAARYADTNGYNNDEVRTMWPWRDWVIVAFQNGMPYDQFLTEQLAGDLLPDSTVGQRVATGFNRNHVLTTEGGIIEEEYHVEYVADRVHTTATVFLALSMQCARCHDHKFDPVSQRDYYRFAAFFDNIPDKIVSYSKGRMAEPLLRVPSAVQQSEMDRLNARRKDVTELLTSRSAVIDADVAEWERSLNGAQIVQLDSLGLSAHFPLDEKDGNEVVDAVDDSRGGVIHGKFARNPGRLGSSLEFDGTTFVDAGQAGAFESDQSFSLSAWFQPSSTLPGTVLSKMDEASAHRGYDVIIENGKVASHFVHQWPDRAFKVITKQPVSLNEWHHVAVTYDGTRQASGVRISVDGKPQELDVTTNNKLDGPLKTDKPFHIGRRQKSAAFRGRIDDVRLFSVALLPAEVQRLAAGKTLGRLQELLAIKPENRTAKQRDQLRDFYAARIDIRSRKLRHELADIPKQLAAIEKAIPVVMVMSEMKPRRSTFILARGEYDQRGEEVTAGLPVALSGDKQRDGVANRLDLARWLTSPSNPLTARVAVNRWWEMLFGTGLVETVEDFGVQGSRPSHPELLDWLATELIRDSWDQRALIRQLVLSATYRQSSDVTPQLLETDPQNRLLSRGPRGRLPAEVVRDNALAISGLLHRKTGGPSVRPYQPAGLWEDVSVERRDKYVADTGAGLYRRSMYTFWKRTCPPPTMSAFDAPDRETCRVRRARTNTPLQALVLLNDPTYVEAARGFAQRVWHHVETDAERLNFAFAIALCRLPRDGEQTVLLDVLNAARQRFGDQSDAAKRLLNVGNSPADPSIELQELAAWTCVTSVILNLDETISKP